MGGFIMAIVIKTKKILSKHGNKLRRLVSINGILPLDTLPKEYIEGSPHIYRMKDKMILTLPTNTFKHTSIQDSICTYNPVAECEFQKFIEGVKKAGNRLHKINKASKKKEKEKKMNRLRKEWEGLEEFVI